MGGKEKERKREVSTGFRGAVDASNRNLIQGQVLVRCVSIGREGRPSTPGGHHDYLEVPYLV